MTINKQWPARRKIVSVAAPLEQLVVCQLRGKTFLFQTKNRCKLLGFSLFLKAAEHQEITKQLFKKRKLWSINGLWQGCSKNVSFEGKKEENEKKLRPKITLGASYGSPDTAFKVEKNSEIKLFMHTNYSLHPWIPCYVVAGLFWVLNLIEKGWMFPIKI